MDRRVDPREPVDSDLWTAVRLDLSDGVVRGAPLEFFVNGHSMSAYPGETVAAALMADGRRAFRSSLRVGEPRGLFCGIGACWECLILVDDTGTKRACVTTVREGMRVWTHPGANSPSPSDRR